MDRRERRWQRKRNTPTQPRPQSQVRQPAVAGPVPLDLTLGEAPEGWVHAFYSSLRTAVQGGQFHRWTATEEPPLSMPRNCLMTTITDDMRIGASGFVYLGLVREDNWTPEDVDDVPPVFDCMAWTTKSDRILFPLCPPN
ncbi:hypothetical protein [Medusavirus stheno T3]|uniref:Uncharacterized protein n=1 Tax=Medusavirus stheno T3 TaxID=3069717 RepID=A0A7S8BER8_9VIRU|nr:hypothetical protein QKU73_gp173 [Acanthamoeba castellanii medusavirus]QPB44602.1 hypothetical protein [Medusavirus stheno T3]